MASVSDLAPAGPLSRIDRALVLVRKGGLRPVVAAWTAGTLPALVAVLGYDLELVEGVHELRPLLALLLVATFALRSIVLSRVAADYARALGDAAPPEPGAGDALATARTSFVVAFFLGLWGGLLLLSSIAGAIGVAITLVFTSLRGAWAPSWLARAGTSPGGGWRAFFAAANDNAGQRGEGLAVEFLVVLGMLGLTFDLLAAMAVLLLLLRSILGIDLALLDGFLSSRNAFALFGALGTSFVLFEPLRAALSALALTLGRVRHGGLDVRAAVDAAIEHADRKKRRRPEAAAGLAAMFCLACLVAPAGAQDTPRGPSDDASANARAAEILAGPAYREFDDERARGLRELLERMLEAMLDTPTESPDVDGGGFLSSIPLPSPTTFIGVGVIGVLLVLFYLVVTRDRGAAPAVAPRAAAKREDPRDRAPTEWMDDAAKLAAEGRFREALRALYVATLVALDRQRAIAFDPALTNWQYLRQLEAGWRREDFRELTRLFDHKWYGHEETAEADYLACRALSERLAAERKQP